MEYKEIRNIAIIAHVDHGKTTLVDAMLRQTGTIEEGVSMDSNALEKERGITIYSKNASLVYKGTKINIVDTPGHADFGSEVERVLRSIDSVLLVVDAQEGPMPQTRFVLKKSLELGLKPIVILNKIDKPDAQPHRAHDQVLELFIELGANDDQLDFTTVYAIGIQGVAKKHIDDEAKDLTPLLDTILEKVPPAPHDTTVPLRMQPFNLAYDDYLGRLAIGRIYEGKIAKGQKIFIKNAAGQKRSGAITKLFTFTGFSKEEVQTAQAGDLIMAAGIPDIDIGETICENEDQQALPAISIDEPTISLDFLVNNSPFGGREGKFVTNNQLRERLEKELEVNVGLNIDFSAKDRYRVYGRGEMHISILLENMRREGYEIQISQPQVITKEIEGKLSEPFEEAIIDVPAKASGSVIEKLSRRGGKMTNLHQTGNHVRLTFEIPTRGLLGYRGEFIIDTRGEGILAARVIGFKPYAGEIEKRTVGSMISMATGKASGYSMDNLQTRGQLYIKPTTEVYEGMVIGNVSKGDELTVNPIKGKQLTNMRSSGTDEAIALTPPLELTIERGMEIMHDDEYLEITPKSIRLRKQLLKEIDRVRAFRKTKTTA
ncbi:MAG: GTP-binding protein TypA [Candidatus Buchananbacteria bacterium RIFCSPLOWO2_01_FULL_46_12]|uniref:50S ribosomal subunit assembly factor BipA n=2 Tax=Candidatus Buchananiibacteriota TaxID=1817903 RepID=A0A1G1YNN9_9BACT|nr:MAG: GTP-binding protein TypA [Candidatus Buchananbacteria bacterium RIFCSPHIGHO2_01_FULL_44_11]OGY53968.1 MAG: GTP-binding protein TypA [Candidatus Buchananbacteria bacterium RIFCSPLOWO2_01_FULL_46_12]